MDEEGADLTHAIGDVDMKRLALLFPEITVLRLGVSDGGAWVELGSFAKRAIAASAFLQDEEAGVVFHYFGVRLRRTLGLGLETVDLVLPYVLARLIDAREALENTFGGIDPRGEEGALGDVGVEVGSVIGDVEAYIAEKDFAERLERDVAILILKDDIEVVFAKVEGVEFRGGASIVFIDFGLITRLDGLATVRAIIARDAIVIREDRIAEVLAVFEFDDVLVRVDDEFAFLVRGIEMVSVALILPTHAGSDDRGSGVA